MNPHLVGRETTCLVNKYPTSRVLFTRTVKKSERTLNYKYVSISERLCTVLSPLVHRIGKEANVA
jgi:hypothetical protein